MKLELGGVNSRGQKKPANASDKEHDHRLSYLRRGNTATAAREARTHLTSISCSYKERTRCSYAVVAILVARSWHLGSGTAIRDRKWAAAASDFETLDSFEEVVLDVLLLFFLLGVLVLRHSRVKPLVEFGTASSLRIVRRRNELSGGLFVLTYIVQLYFLYKVRRAKQTKHVNSGDRIFQAGALSPRTSLSWLITNRWFKYHNAFVKNTIVLY